MLIRTHQLNWMFVQGTLSTIDIIPHKYDDVVCILNYISAIESTARECYLQSTQYSNRAGQGGNYVYFNVIVFFPLFVVQPLLIYD